MAGPRSDSWLGAEPHLEPVSCFPGSKECENYTLWGHLGKIVESAPPEAANPAPAGPAFGSWYSKSLRFVTRSQKS